MKPVHIHCDQQILQNGGWDGCDRSQIYIETNDGLDKWVVYDGSQVRWGMWHDINSVFDCEEEKRVAYGFSSTRTTWLDINCQANSFTETRGTMLPMKSIQCLCYQFSGHLFEFDYKAGISRWIEIWIGKQECSNKISKLSRQSTFFPFIYKTLCSLNSRLFQALNLS